MPCVVPLSAYKIPTRRWVVWALRVSVLALVLVGVGGTVVKAFRDLGQYEWQVRPLWLVISGTLYGMGLLPMGWFWHETLAAFGQPAPLMATLRAYFLGHLGKYVPGKAMAVILRVAAVRKWVPSIRIGMLSCLMETLTMMAVGAFLAAVLSLVLLRGEPLLAAGAVAMALAAAVPTLPPVVRWLAVLGLDKFRLPTGTETGTVPFCSEDSAKGDSPLASRDVDAQLHGINYRLLAKGWCAGGVCWVLLGLSMWATLRAIGADQFSPLADLPRLIAATAFAVVAGFVSMLPGGLVVRDVVLLQLLAPVCGDANALVAAVVLRLVWLVSEVVACGILYIGAGSPEQGARSV
jgi:uncharacterized membrane protein YbhN (UPF0104 family)